MLRLYHRMRLSPEVAFNMCRFTDFQAFTAALLLLLGCHGYGNQSPIGEREQEEDLRLVDLTIGMLRSASSEYGGSVAAQSAQVLTRLRSAGKNVPQAKAGSEQETIAVPYFGTISISPAATSSALAPHDSRIDFTEDNMDGLGLSGSVPADTTNRQRMAYPDSEMSSNKDLPHIDIDWNAVINMDLDQEWNWFPEDETI